MKLSTSSNASHDERGSGQTPPFSRGRRRWVAIAILALAALAAAAASLAIASGQDRGDLVPPSIAVDGSGLATVAWTEVARPGIRVAQESTPGRWSRPLVLDPVGGPGSVAVDRDRLAHIAYTGPGGLVVADQVRRADGGAPAFRRQVVDRRGLGRPAIAITGRGDTAVIYETEGDGLRLALRGSSGRWHTEGIGISADQPQITASARRGIVFAGLRDGSVVLGRTGNARPGNAPAIGESVHASEPLRGFSLTTAGGQPLVSYVDEKDQVVLAARPYEPGSAAGVAAITAGIGNFTAAAGAPTGRAVVLSRNPRYRVLSLALLQGGVRLGDIAVDQGQEGDVAISSDGGRAYVAYWDYPDGRQLHVARVGLEGPEVALNQDLLAFEPTLTPASIASVSTPQATLPRDGKVAIWLAALTLLLTIAAGVLLLLGRRRGIRLLPFAIALGLLAGFAIRGAYLAQLGVYGLPPNDLLTLDRGGVDAVVDALLIVTGATAIMCLAGRLLPVGLGGGLLGRLRGVSLPSPRCGELDSGSLPGDLAGGGGISAGVQRRRGVVEEPPGRLRRQRLPACASLRRCRRLARLLRGRRLARGPSSTGSPAGLRCRRPDSACDQWRPHSRDLGVHRPDRPARPPACETDPVTNRGHRSGLPLHPRDRHAAGDPW